LKEENDLEVERRAGGKLFHFRRRDGIIIMTDVVKAAYSSRKCFTASGYLQCAHSSWS